MFRLAESEGPDLNVPPRQDDPQSIKIRDCGTLPQGAHLPICERELDLLAAQLHPSSLERRVCGLQRVRAVVAHTHRLFHTHATRPKSPTSRASKCSDGGTEGKCNYATRRRDKCLAQLATMAHGQQDMAITQLRAVNARVAGTSSGLPMYFVLHKASLTSAIAGLVRFSAGCCHGPALVERLLL